MLKITKFQLPPPTRLSTVVKYILGGPSCPPPMSNRLRIFESLRSRFFEFGDISTHPREFDHHFCPGAGELDKKIARVAGIRSLKKICPGGCTQLDLTEKLLQYFQYFVILLHIFLKSIFPRIQTFFTLTLYLTILTIHFTKHFMYSNRDIFFKSTFVQKPSHYAMTPTYCLIVLALCHK